MFLNDLSHHAELHSAACGRVAGTATLHVDPSASDVSSLRPEAMPKRWSYSQTFRVAVVRVDDCVPVQGKRIVAKIDVESFEEEVLAGMGTLLANNDVRLFVECLDGSGDGLRTSLEALGYTSGEQVGANTWFARAARS